MTFKLDARENVMAFPCSICKKNNQPEEVCHETCGLYDISSMEVFDLKNDVQKLIDGCRQHPTTSWPGKPTIAGQPNVGMRHRLKTSFQNSSQKEKQDENRQDFRGA